jgi:tetratricopeptide (TPR) repeat protein
MIFYLLILAFAFFQVSSSTAISVAPLLKEVQDDLKAERYLDARQKLENAAKRFADSAVIWSHLGLAHDRLNEIGPAIAALRKALTLAPQDAHLHFHLASLYERKGDVVQALDEYRKGLAIDLTDPTGNESYALLLMRTGKYKDALDPLLRAKKKEDSSLSARLALIECFLKEGMALEGETETQELLASGMASPQDQVKLASVLVENKQPDLAEQVLKVALASAPDLGDAYGVLGLLHQNQGKYEQAEKELSRAIQSTSPARYSLALAQVRLVRQGEPQFPKTDVAWFQNTAPGVAYVGSQSCAACHAEIYESYRKTAMGRSMKLASESQPWEGVPLPATIFDQEQDRYFQVFRQGSDIYQSEYALNSEGQERYRQTEKIAYVIGAGSQGMGYIIRRGNHLFEAPLTFYTRPGVWGLSPGYELNNLGFSRPILEECIVCHSGQPLPIRGRYGLYNSPPFRELAIGCENCHGPGELHVSERAQGPPVSSGFDSTIVNPSKLPGWLADNICMSCHQGGDARVLHPGKSYSDYRPGIPLAYTLATFTIPPNRETPPQSALLEHNFSLRLSRCFRASEGQMRCTTCHDPHRQITGEKKVAYYREKCLSCHTESSCLLAPQDRLRSSALNDCSGCHMPKRPAKEIEHAALTNHRIVKRADQPYPENAFSLTTPSLPKLIHVSALPGRDASAVPALTLLQAYRSLSLNHPEYEEPYARLLTELAQSQRDDPIVLAALAQKLMSSQTPQARSEGIGYLSRAIERGSTSPNDYLLLADLLARSNRVPESIDILKKGIFLAPYVSEFYQSMATRFLSIGKYSDALDTIRKGKELFPGDPAVNVLLGKAEQSLVPPNGSKTKLPRP